MPAGRSAIAQAAGCRNRNLFRPTRPPKGHRGRGQGVGVTRGRGQVFQSSLRDTMQECVTGVGVRSFNLAYGTRCKNA
jgi:hypothetical protein